MRIFNALLSFGLFFGVEAVAKIRILTFHDQPDFVAFQDRAFKAFLKDDYEWIVFNDAQTDSVSDEVKRISDRIGIKSVRFKQDWHRSDPSRDVASDPKVKRSHVIQYALDYFGYTHDDIVVLMDGDCFPLKFFSFRELLSDYFIGGIRCFEAGNEKLIYLSPVCTFFKPKELPNKYSLKFHPTVIGNHLSGLGFASHQYLKTHPTLSTKFWDMTANEAPIDEQIELLIGAQKSAKLIVNSPSLSLGSFAHERGSRLKEPFPIQFGIPSDRIVNKMPIKEKDFGTVIPWQWNTYVFEDEQSYFQDYQKSYYGATCKKGGWDCMRHYEILANGSIPYFFDLDQCDSKNLSMLPKELIFEAMHLPGINYELKTIDHSIFDHARYEEIVEELLAFTRAHLTAEKMAQYLLEKVNYSGTGEILFLSQDIMPDYMRCVMLTGLKQLLGKRVIDSPKIPHIYTNYPGNIKALYGKGISYTKNVEDLFVDRENIEQKIKNHHYDLIIYGSVHRGMPFHELVLKTYPPSKVAYICGEDAHDCRFKDLENFFLREW